MAVTIIPSLKFPGNAREAVAFYESIFGGESNLTIAGDWPQEFEEGSLEGIEDYVMHGELKTPDFSIFVYDHLGPSPFQEGNNMSLTLSVATADEAETLYFKLVEEAETYQALAPTSYSSNYAFLRDKFGINWEIIADMPMEDQ